MPEEIQRHVRNCAENIVEAKASLEEQAPNDITTVLPIKEHGGRRRCFENRIGRGTGPLRAQHARDQQASHSNGEPAETLN
jgi:hypothetical protein